MKAINLKRSIFVILMITILLLSAIPIGVSAAETISNFEYSILDDGTVEITKYIDNGERNVLIPEEIDGKSVTSISDFCFVKTSSPVAVGFENIESISIPKTVTYFAPNFLVLQYNLKEIIVDGENTKYASIDGVLFDKDIKTLLYYPRSKPSDEYITPDTVKSIKSFSFFQNMTLKKLKFGTVLDDVDLSGILALEEIEYPVTSIKYDEGIIQHCTNLSKVIINKEVSFIPDNEFSAEYSVSPDVTLYVYDNSYGLEWAKSHDFPYEVIEETHAEKDLVDENTGIQVSGVMDADATLNIKSIENTVEDAVSTFDITLTKYGDIIQPDGEITISIPSEYNDCDVFWVKDDGTKVNMNAEYIDGKYVFTTDHLSVYALVRKSVTLLGDVNGDGKVGIDDATNIQKYMAEILDFTDKQKELADVNKDGKVGVDDVTLIQKHMAGLAVIE